MNPAFSSWTAFLAMGGYALYVWLAVACALLSLGGLFLHTVVQRRRLLSGIRQRHAREHRIRAAKMKKAAAEAAGEQP